MTFIWLQPIFLWVTMNRKKQNVGYLTIYSWKKIRACAFWHLTLTLMWRIDCLPFQNIGRSFRQTNGDNFIYNIFVRFNWSSREILVLNDFFLLPQSVLYNTVQLTPTLSMLETYEDIVQINSDAWKKKSSQKGLNM